MNKNSSLRFMSFVHFFQKSGCFFGKFTAELILNSFSGRNKSLEAPVFGLSNSLPYDLEIWDNRHSKMPKISADNFFLAFLSCYYGFTNSFEILNSRSYGRLLESPKTGASRDLFLPEKDFKISSAVNFPKTLRFLKPRNEPKTWNSD